MHRDESILGQRQKNVSENGSEGKSDAWAAVAGGQLQGSSRRGLLRLVSLWESSASITLQMGPIGRFGGHYATYDR